MPQAKTANKRSKSNRRGRITSNSRIAFVYTFRLDRGANRLNLTIGKSAHKTQIADIFVTAIHEQPAVIDLGLIAVRGQVLDPAFNLPSLAEAALATQFNTVFQDLLHDPSQTHAISGPLYKFQLRIFTDDVIARKWVESNIPRNEPNAPDFVPTTFSDHAIVLQRALQTAMGSVPADYQARRQALAQLSDAVRTEVAELFGPALNAESKKRPHATYEQKKELAKWINAETRRFGLALKAPKTDAPCFIVATTGNHPTVGRFVFDYIDDQGKRRHPMSSATMPTLELMPADLSRISPGTRGTVR